jgi:protein-S-isoprenylcysteine O-methyltransferase Ste14
MWVLVRAVTYSTLFIGFLLIFLPARLLAWSSISPPPNAGTLQIIGMLIAGLGAALALWCILTFVFQGKGTPAPFDPPRRLVIRGPYKLIRNPMYVGAILMLLGAALSYKSIWLVGYAVMFVIVMHGFVVLYEEPTLRSSFGDDYIAYCQKVGRWWPSFR